MFKSQKTGIAGITTVKSVASNGLVDTTEGGNCTPPIPLARLFACFERSELGFFAVDSASFTQTSQNETRKWELVDANWFSTVRGLIERSMANPKSLEKLFGVVDLYDRARAKGAGIFHAGDGGLRGAGRAESSERAEVGDRAEGGGAGRTGGCGPEVGSEPQAKFDASWASVWGGSESDLAEVIEVEQRVNAFRESRDLDLSELDGWTADELRAERERDALRADGAAESAGADGEGSFHTGGGGLRGGIESRKPGIRSRSRRPAPALSLPKVGAVIELGRRIESFGGFVSPGPVEISAAYVGGCGRGFVNLARDGRVVATGVAWPIGV